MTYQSVEIQAGDVYDDGAGHWFAEELEGVHVSLAGEARTNGDEESGAEFRCVNCGSPLDDEGLALDTDTNREVCPEGECDLEEEEARDGCVMDHPHTPERVPLSWANSAGISLDEESDTISVRISVGDPRGAFVMTVERMRYTDPDGTEHDELRLSVPTPDSGWLHMPLTPLASPGYYRIGG